jgi:hypothetical protein
MHATRITLLLAPVAALLLVGVAASAQPVKAKPEKLAKIETHYMDTRLALTSEQRRQVESVNLDFAKKLEPVMKDGPDTPGREQKVKALEDARDAQLAKVLTKDQFSRYQEDKSDMGDWVREQLRDEAGHGN